MNPNLINIDMEKSVLATLMSIDDSYDTISGTVRVGDFVGKHQVIYQAISDLANNGEPYDFVMVFDKLDSTGELKSAGGEGYLSDILNNSPASLFNLESYAESVRMRADRRQAIVHLQDAVKQLEVSPETTADVSNAVMDNLTNVLTGSEKAKFLNVEAMMVNFAENLKNTKNHGMQTTKTGFIELDNKMLMSDGDLVVVAARPSMGKTALVMNWLTDIAKTQEGTAVFFSLEMSSNQIMERMASAESKINMNNIRSGQMNENEWASLYQFMQSQNELPLVVVEKTEITIGAIRTELKRIEREQRKNGVADGKLSVIAVDYLQIMGGLDGSDRINKIGVVTRTLKALGKEYNCPVVLLSQLSRSVEQRPNKRPISSDLRDSGTIEQDADIVAMIYRDDYYKSKEADSKGRVASPPDGLAEIILKKNRNGATGSVLLGFEGHYSRFVEQRPELLVNSDDFYCNDHYAGANQ